MVSSGTIACAKAASALRPSATSRQRRVVRVSSRRCRGRVARKPFVRKVCVGASARFHLPSETEALIIGGDCGSEAKSLEFSVNDDLPLDMDGRAAMAASAFLARMRANGLVDCFADPAESTAREPQDVRIERDEAVRLEFEDRAAAAASSLLERIRTKTLDAQSAACRVRRVRFDMAAVVVHPITPYCEIYGLHPRCFVFGRNYSIVPAAPGGYVSLTAMRRQNDDDDDDESSDSDEEW